jgi:hypothetical protein
VYLQVEVCSFANIISHEIVYHCSEAFSNVCLDHEVPNKTAIHGFVTKFRGATKQLKSQSYRFQVTLQLQQHNMAAKIRYYHWFYRLVREGSCIVLRVAL